MEKNRCCIAFFFLSSVSAVLPSFADSRNDKNVFLLISVAPYTHPHLLCPRHTHPFKRNEKNIPQKMQRTAEWRRTFRKKQKSRRGSTNLFEERARIFLRKRASVQEFRRLRSTSRVSSWSQRLASSRSFPLAPRETTKGRKKKKLKKKSQPLPLSRTKKKEHNRSQCQQHTKKKCSRVFFFFSAASLALKWLWYLFFFACGVSLIAPPCYRGKIR